MDDLISRQAAIDGIHDAWMNGAYYTETINTLKHLPTIDAVPVVHGEWIWEKDVICSPRTCSVCKHTFYIGRA